MTTIRFLLALAIIPIVMPFLRWRSRRMIRAALMRAGLLLGGDE